VVSCSALRRHYRDLVAEDRPWVELCLLEVPAEVLRARLELRRGHFMPSDLLPSQLALLESLGAAEAGTTVDASGDPDDMVTTLLERWGLSR
jgi:gluconokinase